MMPRPLTSSIQNTRVRKQPQEVCGKPRTEWRKTRWSLPRVVSRYIRFAPSYSAAGGINDSAAIEYGAQSDVLFAASLVGITGETKQSGRLD